MLPAMTEGANPFSRLTTHVPFHAIEADQIEPAIDALIERARANIEAIKALEGPRTLDNTLLALERSTEDLSYAMTIVAHLESVDTSDELRAAYNAVQPKVSAFYARIPLDAELFAAVREFAETDEARNLDPLRARLLKKTLDDFRRHGAALEPAAKDRLAELGVELAQITQKFSEQVLDATNAFELVITDEAQLAGLPESARDAARHDAEAKGLEGWRFTLQAPSYIPLMTYLDDAGIREQVWRAYNTRATSGELDNRPLAAKILEMRAEKAALLGYADFADYVLEDRMARSGERAWSFVEDLRQRSETYFERENQELIAFRQQHVPDAADTLEPWEVGYWAEKQRRALYDFDEEALRPYFPLDSVMRGMFELVDRLYGITVREVEGFERWHDDVKVFGVFDGTGQDAPRLGVFYADLHPREEKRGGAWMHGFLTGIAGDEGRDEHLGLIAGNMSKPVGGKPALLTHREVETVFHEFGHLLHHMLTRVEVRSLAGTNVAWDFVELPSQIMENWCWEREALDLFARHHETGEAIPDELFQKMHRARNFRSANAMMRQLGFATVDLALHTRYDAKAHGDVQSYARDILQAFAVSPLPEDYGMVFGFTHIFASPTGYAAGYYSYKWAGVFDRETGMRFREHILARGDSREPDELYREFRGREPSLDALLERSGLSGAAA